MVSEFPEPSKPATNQELLVNRELLPVTRTVLLEEPAPKPMVTSRFATVPLLEITRLLPLD